MQTAGSPHGTRTALAVWPVVPVFSRDIKGWGMQCSVQDPSVGFLTDMMRNHCDTILVHFILAMNLKMFRWSYERDFSCILLFFAVRFAGPNFVYVGQGDES